ncbi:MAG TPA: DnaJ domain-containing protein [Burkholderiaceae bacterium]|jgi:DnaJ-class molecular chaperone
MKTLYDLLGVDAGATQAQIEQGYKRQLDRYLERRNAGKHDQETRRMQNMREAYLLLCSPQKRRIYDQQLKMFQKARAQLFRRSNLVRAALLTLGLLAAIAAIYVRQTMHDQAMFKAGPSQSDQASTDTRHN